MNQPKSTEKPFAIPKQAVVEAFKKVKENQGGPGVDGCTIEEFESELRDRLYVTWNRMSSGSYVPPPVKVVKIPKPHGGGMRMLGVPTVIAYHKVVQAAFGFAGRHTSVSSACGERLEVLFVRRIGAGRIYVCEGGPLGSVSLPEDATDRGSGPAERPLSIEVLAALVALVVELGGEQGVAR